VSGLALALVLASAGIHATWNYLTKRMNAKASDAWLFTVLSVVIYAPLALGIVLIRHPHLGGRELLLMSGTAILHAAYFLLLLRAYREGGLSLVYPLARGTGPLLATAAAIAFLHERPSALALTGASLIGISVFVLAGSPRKLIDRGAGPAILYALLTGGTIALYTLWDKYAVSVAAMHPLVLNWGGEVGRAVLYTPIAFTQWANVRTRLRAFPREILAIALLSPLAYIMVLTALAFTPVSYVAPLREVSILIGAAMGARFLAEGDVTRRIAAAATMVAGVVLLSVG
jgi:drug/metabolite transporter (DMT)-like permease